MLCVVTLLLMALATYSTTTASTITSSTYKIERTLQYFQNHSDIYRSAVSKFKDKDTKNFALKTLHKLHEYNSTSNALENPIDVQRILEMLSNIRLLMTMLLEKNDPSREYLKALPTMEDAKEASKKLMELQWLYKIPPHEVSKGYFGADIQKTSPMDSYQCFLNGLWTEALNLINLRDGWLVEGLHALMVESGGVGGGIPRVLNERFTRDTEEKIFDQLMNYLLQNNDKELADYVARTMTLLYGYNRYLTCEERNHLFHNCVKGIETARKRPSKRDSRNNMWNEMSRYCQAEKFSNEGYCRYHTPSPFHKIGPIQEEVLSEIPVMKLWHNVFKQEEIDFFIRHGIPSLQRALKRNPEGKREDNTERISEVVFLEPDSEDEYRMHENCDEKLAILTGLNIEKNNRNSEPFQVNNYGMGGYFGRHLDSFDYDDYQKLRKSKNPPPERFIDDPTGQLSPRLATVTMYISDVKKGGGTYFPQLDITVQPRKGSALFWINNFRHGVMDRLMIHGGCPVMSGSKWIVNKWIHYHGQILSRPCARHFTRE